MLEAIKKDMVRLFDDDYIVCQLDEACFSAKKNDRKHWAPKGKPFDIQERWTTVQQLKARGVICEEVGLVYCAYKEEAFLGVDMADILKTVR